MIAWLALGLKAAAPTARQVHAFWRRNRARNLSRAVRATLADRLDYAPVTRQPLIDEWTGHLQEDPDVMRLVDASLRRPDPKYREPLRGRIENLLNGLEMLTVPAQEAADVLEEAISDCLSSAQGREDARHAVAQQQLLRRLDGLDRTLDQRGGSSPPLGQRSSGHAVLVLSGDLDEDLEFILSKLRNEVPVTAAKLAEEIARTERTASVWARSRFPPRT